MNTSKTYLEKTRDRKDGTGEFRVGKPMVTEFDLYSMLYVTTLYPEYVYLIKKAYEEREHAIDSLIDTEE